MNRRSLVLGAGGLALVGAAAGASLASMGSADDYAQAMAALRAPLAANADIRDIIRHATLAANGHNTQPWRFKLTANSVRIAPDLARRTPAVDPDDHHLYVSLGCAAENLAIAARSRGLLGEPRFDADGDGALVYEHVRGAAQQSPLAAAIRLRQSTRAPFDGRAVAPADLAALARTAAMPGVELVFITARTRLDQLRDLIIAGNNVQMADRAFMTEFKHWMRFNPRAAMRRGDGLFSASSGNPALPDWLGPTMFDLVFKPEAENDKYARQISATAGVAVFVGAAAAPAHWAQVGRAAQRFALAATAMGLKLSFVNQPVEVARLRPALAALIGAPGRRPDLVMRFGYGTALPLSARRPAEAVIEA